MDYSQNGPFKVSIQETRFVLKTIKIVDPISKIWFQDVARKTIKGSIVLDFFVENPIEGEMVGRTSQTRIFWTLN